MQTWVERARSPSRQAGHLDGAVEIPLQPAHISDPAVGLQVRPKVNHALEADGLGKAALFNQRIAQQAVVEGERALRDEFFGNNLGLRKAMKANENVAAQEQRCRTLRVGSFQCQCALFSQLVKALIVSCPCLGDVKPTQLFQEWARIGRRLTRRCAIWMLRSISAAPT